jgi:hypothetical protein
VSLSSCQSDSLSSGAIGKKKKKKTAGIVVGSVVGGVIIGVLVVWFIHRQKLRKDALMRLQLRDKELKL